MARPDSKLTEENIIELERRFRDGATILEAIDGIMAESTYHEHRKNNPEFEARMQMAKEYITEIARGVVAKRIKRADPDMAKWWLERKNKQEFSTKTETDIRVKELPKPIMDVTDVQQD
jgi:hypothetical protein